jgi:methionyl-tRNA formyltransferase
LIPESYIFATAKPWNSAAIVRRKAEFPGPVELLERPCQLTPERLLKVAPRYIFFPHWSWIVPAAIVNQFECVCFHMTDVPYGRGGSPLQNLIERGHTETKISALRMTEEIDGGPVYLKHPLDLGGHAQAIFERAADIMVNMALEISRTNPQPRPQLGEPTLFQRRTPDQSCLPTEASLEKIFDHIRMLDAETYPRAFIQHGALRLTFSNATRSGDLLEAKVTIARKPQEMP